MVTVKSEGSSQLRVCKAYAFEITNSDGTRSLCMGCDLQRSGQCTRRGLPVIGYTNFNVSDPEYLKKAEKMKELASELRVSCVNNP